MLILDRDYSFNTISLFSNIDKTTILERLEQGRLTGCGPCVPPATELEVNESLRVVAQMGYEPFFDAMTANPGFNIIIGGRAYDPSPYVAFCVYQLTRQSNHLSTEELHSRLGGFYHMGKILECGGQCSFPKSHGAVATVYENGLFDVRPTDPQSICTSLSVAAHTLYENTRPDVLQGPGGSLHLDHSKYEQLSDGKSVRVGGSVYRSSESDDKPYQLKLEAARIVGYRSMFMGSITDRKSPYLKAMKSFSHYRYPRFTDRQTIGPRQSLRRPTTPRDHWSMESRLPCLRQRPLHASRARSTLHRC